MKTQICTVGDDGVGFRFLSTLKINGLQSPYHAFVYKFQFLAHFPFPAKFNNLGDYPIYRQNLGRSAKSKIPDRLGFSRHEKIKHHLFLSRQIFLSLPNLSHRKFRVIPGE